MPTGSTAYSHCKSKGEIMVFVYQYRQCEAIQNPILPECLAITGVSVNPKNESSYPCAPQSRFKQARPRNCPNFKSRPSEEEKGFLAPLSSLCRSARNKRVHFIFLGHYVVPFQPTPKNLQQSNHRRQSCPSSNPDSDSGCPKIWDKPNKKKVISNDPVPSAIIRSSAHRTITLINCSCTSCDACNHTIQTV